MFVIGTAGHVDHGKSALVQALTGIDPDRLQEEKVRGMTIDLGFAWLKLPGGAEVSIVDVPGHERFIKNMLAGVGGIDLALLVIAADEGVMPQTREHLAILDLLGVERGVIALTKSDLVDADWLDLVAADAATVVEGTSLERSPIVRCSAVSGDGLPELLAAIESRLAATPPKRDLGRPRLPIDRVFTIAGFGTVVTGTLIDGALSVGQEVEVVPALVGGHVTTLRSRLRGLQTHRSKVETALPGTRTAANLVGLAPEELARGQVVTTPGWLPPSTAVDVRLRALASLRRPLRHNLSVSFHSLASETPAKLRLLEDDEVGPGESAWAQVRLLRPVAVLKGDRFVLRDANDTIGGGVVVETQARRHVRRRPAVIERLAGQASSSPADVLYAAVAGRGLVEPAAAFSRIDLDEGTAAAAFATLVAEGRLLRLGEEGAGLVATRDDFDALGRRAAAALAAYFQEHPLRRGLLKEELRSRLGLSQRPFALLLARLETEGVLVDGGRGVSLPGREPAPTPAQSAAAAAYLAALNAAPFAPPVDGRPDEELVAFLVETGAVVEIGGIVFAADAYERMVAAVTGRLAAKGTLTLAEARDLLATSRRYVQALLEHLDAERVTLRRGDERIPGPRAP